MHVGLNLIYLVPGETGGLETYARELIPALLNTEPDLELTAFLSREAAENRDSPWCELVPSVTVPVRARRRAEWVRGEQLLLPGIAVRAGVNLVHSLASTGPARGSFRRVVTIHDLVYRHYPDAHFGFRALGMRVLVPLAARRSHRIIAPSVHAKSDIVHLLRIPGERVDVVPEGVDAKKGVRPFDREELRRRYNLGSRPLLLTAAAKRPHKNLMRLLDALALVPAERRPVLVLPGYSTPHEHELREHSGRLGLDADTRFVGWIPDQDLDGLYQLASCFVFPSLYEGFGLPVLEAMARGVPVACSNRASLPEVAGDAALFFEPEQPRAIAAVIERILFDPKEAERLRRLGRERVGRFTWAATARGTLATYRLAMNGAEDARNGQQDWVERFG